VAEIEQSKLSFRFQLTPPDGPLDSDWNRLLNVVADLQVVVGDRILFSEVNLPIVELANQLDHWLASAAQPTPEFLYSSLESDIVGIIRIAPGVQGWHVSSAFAEFADSTPFSLAEIVAAARSYVTGVEKAVLSEYGFRPSELSPS